VLGAFISAGLTGWQELRCFRFEAQIELQQVKTLSRKTKKLWTEGKRGGRNFKKDKKLRTYFWYLGSEKFKVTSGRFSEKSDLGSTCCARNHTHPEPPLKMGSGRDSVVNAAIQPLPASAHWHV
jgi:hypothetical protein